MAIALNGNFTYKGTVLYLRSTIDYEDIRDMYGCVWNETTQNVEIVDIKSDEEYLKSKADASDAIWDKAVAWAQKIVRGHKAKKTWETRQWEIETAHECGLTRPQYVRLEAALGKYTYPVRKILASYKNNRLRSEFRKSLAKQVMDWVKDKAPKYKSPLSPKQIGALIKGTEYLYRGNGEPDMARAFMVAHNRKLPTPLNRANDILRSFGFPTFYGDGFDEEW